MNDKHEHPIVRREKERHRLSTRTMMNQLTKRLIEREFEYKKHRKQENLNVVTFSNRFY